MMKNTKFLKVKKFYKFVVQNLHNYQKILDYI